MHGERRGAALHEVVLLAAAGKVHGHGQVVARGELGDPAEHGGVAHVDGSGRDADRDAVGVHFLGPMHDVVLGGAHGVIDAALVHDAHLAIDHAAKAELLGRRAGSARGGDVGHAGDAGRKRIQAAQDGGVVPVGHFHLRGEGGNGSEPGDVGDVVHDAPHDRVLHMSVEVDQTGHDGGRSVVEHLFVRIAQPEHLGFADVPNSSVSNENSAPDDGVGGDGQNILCAQQHSLSLTRPWFH